MTVYHTKILLVCNGDHEKKKNLWFVLFALFLNNVKLIVLLFFFYRKRSP